MKKILIILFLFILTGCAAKYEVVQKLRVNMYHLVNTPHPRGRNNINL